jgi:hypothetical protein
MLVGKADLLVESRCLLPLVMDIPEGDAHVHIVGLCFLVGAREFPAW